MNHDKLVRLEKQYRGWLTQKPFFINSEVKLADGKNYSIWINYQKGMTIATKKEIATEMGDIPLKFNEVKTQ